MQVSQEVLDRAIRAAKAERDFCEKIGGPYQFERAIVAAIKTLLERDSAVDFWRTVCDERDAAIARAETAEAIVADLNAAAEVCLDSNRKLESRVAELEKQIQVDLKWTNGIRAEREALASRVAELESQLAARPQPIEVDDEKPVERIEHLEKFISSKQQRIAELNTEIAELRDSQAATLVRAELAEKELAGLRSQPIGVEEAMREIESLFNRYGVIGAERASTLRTILARLAGDPKAGDTRPVADSLTTLVDAVSRPYYPRKYETTKLIDRCRAIVAAGEEAAEAIDRMDPSNECPDTPIVRKLLDLILGGGK